MTSYKIDYSKIRQLPALGKVISALERGFNRFDLDFYLVGAVARDVWMSGIHGLAPNRTTGDVDFAVLINENGLFEQLKEYLMAEEGFHPSKENAFVLIFSDGTEVDLLPFGSVEDASGRVTIQGTGFTTVDVPGFKEIYEEGLPLVDLEGEHTFKFCTLPGIVILKLIAWDDRPESREKDIQDIGAILRNFFSMYDAEIWENHNDLFEDENDNLQFIAAKVMGREMKKIAQRNPRLLARIKGILDNHTSDIQNSKMANLMARHAQNTIEENFLLIQELKNGLEE